MTLLELLVVLLLLGLAASLVAPVLRLPAGRGARGDGAGDESPGDRALGRAADAARGLALRRGESLVLAVAGDGRWTVRPAVAPSGGGGSDTAPLLAGRVAAGAPLRVIVSPVGTCVPDPTGAAPGPGVWDAARCRPAAAAR